jgi:Domain of unknown function (DUF5753)
LRWLSGARAPGAAGQKQRLYGWFQEWADIEAQATVLRWYEPLVVPGLLQTEDYARAILSARPDGNRLRDVGRADRLEYGPQPGRDAAVGPGQQRCGTPPQAAPVTPAAFVKLVLDPAVGAGMRDLNPGAVCAGAGARAGRGDQPPLPPAGHALPWWCSAAV